MLRRRLAVAQQKMLRQVTKFDQGQIVLRMVRICRTRGQLVGIRELFADRIRPMGASIEKRGNESLDRVAQDNNFLIAKLSRVVVISENDRQPVVDYRPPNGGSSVLGYMDKTQATGRRLRKTHGESALRNRFHMCPISCCRPERHRRKSSH